MNRQLLIVGGRFAGLWAALAAAKQAADRAGGIDIRLLSPEPYLVNRPRLYERDPEALRTPLAPSLDPVGVIYEAGAAQAIDTAGQKVHIARPDGSGAELTYDRLILATGSALKPLAIPGFAEHTWNVDSFEGALAFDGHLAQVLSDPTTPGGDCFVIAGAGFAGIEMACEMRARIEAHAGPARARAARVILVERSAMVGPDLGPNPCPVIEHALQVAGVEVRLGAGIAELSGDDVALAGGERIATRTVIATTGLKANALTECLGGERDDLGRLATDEMLRVEGVASVFAAGDVARASTDGVHLALMSCQHSIAMGRAAGANAARDLLGLALAPYRQERYVTCLDLGPAGAVYTTGWERQVEKTGAEAKKVKIGVVTRGIAPPTGTAEDIFAAALTPPHRRRQQDAAD